MVVLWNLFLRATLRRQLLPAGLADQYQAIRTGCNLGARSSRSAAVCTGSCHRAQDKNHQHSKKHGVSLEGLMRVLTRIITSVFFFDSASHAIDHTDCEYEDSAENAEYSDQPDKHGRRVFVTIHDQRDKQDSRSNEEIWQCFVDGFWQSQGLILYADRRSATQDALYRSHVRCPTTAANCVSFMVKHRHICDTSHNRGVRQETNASMALP